MSCVQVMLSLYNHVLRCGSRKSKYLLTSYTASLPRQHQSASSLVCLVLSVLFSTHLCSLCFLLLYAYSCIDIFRIMLTSSNMTRHVPNVCSVHNVFSCKRQPKRRSICRVWKDLAPEMVFLKKKQ
jgi:hypothetical protein